MADGLRVEGGVAAPQLKDNTHVFTGFPAVTRCWWLCSPLHGLVVSDGSVGRGLGVIRGLGGWGGMGGEWDW
ncbi:MAG: hypothetical protein K2J97_01515, partial [Muribaculaceae bacterium]|nr:hypothetical protein [Muribaculaceae bacterium]